MGLIIDVSHWEELIDWPRAQAAGVERAIFKLTHGRHGGDPYALRNWNACGLLGIKRGVFGWLVPSAHDETLQARNLWQFADALGFDPAVDWFVAGDVEEIEELTAASAYAFLSAIGDRFGFAPWHYSNPNILANILGRPDWARLFPLWLAGYSSAPSIASPAGWPAWSLWQYSKRGRVPGIVGDVDLNRLPPELPSGIFYSVRVTAARGLNVRAGAGIEFPKIDALEAGALVNVFDELGAWLSIGGGRWIAAVWTARI